MTAYSHNKYNVALTTRSPFGAVLARRHFTGSIIVGGAWQSERSIQAVLDELKARLKKELGQNWLKAGVIALIEDSEAGRALADLAENAIPLGWTYVYQPIEVIRQSLERLYFVSRGRQLPSCRLMRIALARGSWRTGWKADFTMRWRSAFTRLKKMMIFAAMTLPSSPTGARKKNAGV